MFNMLQDVIKLNWQGAKKLDELIWQEKQAPQMNKEMHGFLVFNQPILLFG